MPTPLVHSITPSVFLAPAGASFHPIFRSRFRHTLPLHIGRSVRASVFQGLNMIDDVTKTRTPKPIRKLGREKADETPGVLLSFA